jgi:hypothetical protein
MISGQREGRRVDHTEDFDRYRHLSACFTCPLRPRYTPTQRRIIKRWENEDVLDRMQASSSRRSGICGCLRRVPGGSQPPDGSGHNRRASCSDSGGRPQMSTR